MLLFGKTECVVIGHCTAMEGSSIILWSLLALASGSVNPTDRERRSFDPSSVPILASLFEGEQENQLPNLASYPLWKVHRYHGISLQPIPLPEERVPIHPVAQSQDEEAPSIVNVPDPHYAPKEPIPLPLTEYGPPAPSAPYPPSSAPSGPYPPLSAPSGPYRPASSPPGSYAPVNPPSAPYPPIYNAPLPSDHKGDHHISSHSEVFSPQSDGHLGDFLSHLRTGDGVDTVIQGLLSILPSDIVQKLHQFVSTPEGRERITAILGIATNAKKLKTGAARSLQDIIARLFGGAGGSTDIALQSGTYTKIPYPYPAPQGILNGFKPIGTGVSGSLLPTFPQPTLPPIPGLERLPDTPALPHINLPSPTDLMIKGVGGHYVSISLPQASNTYSLPENQKYSPPANSYGPPTPSYSPPTNTYGQPASTYGTPSQSYSPPAPQIPSTSYGVPTGPARPYQPSYDQAVAASETHEELQSRERGQKEAEVTPLPLKTTKLTKSQEPLSYQSDDLRRYLDADHPAAFKPSDPLPSDEEDQEEGKC